MATRKTTTTILKDGTTTTKTTGRSKRKPPVIDGEKYSDYKQTVHVFAVATMNKANDIVSMIDSILQYWPLGEFGMDLQAVKKVMCNTACFCNGLQRKVIGEHREISEEATIDF